MQATTTQDLATLAANPNLDITSVSFKTRLALSQAQATINPGAGKLVSGSSLIAVVSKVQTLHSLGPNSSE